MEVSSGTLRPLQELLWSDADLEDKDPAKPHNQLVSFLQNELGGPVTSLEQIGKFLDSFHWKMNVPTNLSVPLCQQLAALCNYIFLFGERAFLVVKAIHPNNAPNSINEMERAVATFYLKNGENIAYHAEMPKPPLSRNRIIELLHENLKDVRYGCWRYLELPRLRMNLRRRGILKAMERFPYGISDYVQGLPEHCSIFSSSLLLFWGFSYEEVQGLASVECRWGIARDRGLKGSHLAVLKQALIPINQIPLSAFEVLLKIHPELLDSKEDGLGGMRLFDYLYLNRYFAMKGQVSKLLAKSVDSFSIGQSYHPRLLPLDLVQVCILPEVLPQLKSFTCGATKWTAPACELLLMTLAKVEFTPQLEHLDLRLPMDILGRSSNVQALLASLYSRGEGSLEEICLHCEAIEFQGDSVESWHRRCADEDPWVVGTKKCFQAVAKALSFAGSGNKLKHLTITGCASQAVRDIVAGFFAHKTVFSLDLQPHSRSLYFKEQVKTPRRVNICNLQMESKDWISLSQSLSQLQQDLVELIMAPPEPYWVLPVLYLVPRLRALRLTSCENEHDQDVPVDDHVDITAPLAYLVRMGTLELLHIGRTPSHGYRLEAEAFCEAVASQNTLGYLYLMKVDLIGTDVPKLFLDVFTKSNNTGLKDFIAYDLDFNHYGRLPSWWTQQNAAVHYKGEAEARQVCYLVSMNACGRGECQDQSTTKKKLAGIHGGVPKNLRSGRRAANMSAQELETATLSCHYGLLQECVAKWCGY